MITVKYQILTEDDEILTGYPGRLREAQRFDHDDRAENGDLLAVDLAVDFCECDFADDPPKQEHACVVVGIFEPPSVAGKYRVELERVWRGTARKEHTP